MNKPKQLESLTSRNIEDQTIIIDLNGKRLFHQLNETASFIWTLCTGENSIDDLSIYVANEFDVSVEEAKADIQAIIQDFRSADLITDNV